jgi:hypothetical protein
MTGVRLFVCIIFLFSSVQPFTARAQSTEKIVLLPLSVPSGLQSTRDVYAASIQDALSGRYTVIYGPSVNKALNKFLSGSVCASPNCIQEVANEFNAELIVDAQIRQSNRETIFTFSLVDVSESSVLKSHKNSCLACNNSDLFDFIRSEISMEMDEWKSVSKQEISGGNGPAIPVKEDVEKARVLDRTVRAQPSRDTNSRPANFAKEKEGLSWWVYGLPLLALGGGGGGGGGDAFPRDANETADLDSDGIGDNADTDRDGDGVANARDAFPRDANETADLDSDGIGDNADTDRDGDGVANASDAFPIDNRYTTNADNDNLPVELDPQPNSASVSTGSSNVARENSPNSVIFGSTQRQRIFQHYSQNRITRQIQSENISSQASASQGGNDLTARMDLITTGEDGKGDILWFRLSSEDRTLHEELDGSFSNLVFYDINSGNADYNLSVPTQIEGNENEWRAFVSDVAGQKQAVYGESNSLADVGRTYTLMNGKDSGLSWGNYFVSLARLGSDASNGGIISSYLLGGSAAYLENRNNIDKRKFEFNGASAGWTNKCADASCSGSVVTGDVSPVVSDVTALVDFYKESIAINFSNSMAGSGGTLVNLNAPLSIQNGSLPVLAESWTAIDLNFSVSVSFSNLTDWDNTNKTFSDIQSGDITAPDGFAEAENKHMSLIFQGPVGETLLGTFNFLNKSEGSNSNKDIYYSGAFGAEMLKEEYNFNYIYDNALGEDADLRTGARDCPSGDCINLSNSGYVDLARDETFQAFQNTPHTDGNLWNANGAGAVETRNRRIGVSTAFEEELIEVKNENLSYSNFAVYREKEGRRWTPFFYGQAAPSGTWTKSNENASFLGWSAGASFTNNEFYTSSKVRVDVDFAGRTFDFISNNTYQSSNIGPGDLAPSLDFTASGFISKSGTISATSFDINSGTDRNGQLMGRFFGPNAEEVAGQWKIYLTGDGIDAYNEATNGNSRHLYVASFGAKR